MPRGVYERTPENTRPATIRPCEHCGKPFKLPNLGQRFCTRECKHAAQTTGRKSVRKTITKARSAQSLLAYHVKTGNIIKPTACQECGKTNCKIEGSHHDYDRPLDVRWLCIPCHRKLDWADPKGVTYEVPITG
jgi:hypothetical protein